MSSCFFIANALRKTEMAVICFDLYHRVLHKRSSECLRPGLMENGMAKVLRLRPVLCRKTFGRTL